MGWYIIKEIVTGARIGSSDRDIDCLLDLLGDLAHSLLVECVAHCGHRDGPRRFATLSSDRKETFLLGKMLAEGEQGGKLGK